MGTHRYEKDEIVYTTTRNQTKLNQTKPASVSGITSAHVAMSRTSPRSGRSVFLFFSFFDVICARAGVQYWHSMKRCLLLVLDECVLDQSYSPHLHLHTHTHTNIHSAYTCTHTHTHTHTHSASACTNTHTHTLTLSHTAHTCTHTHTQLQRSSVTLSK